MVDEVGFMWMVFLVLVREYIEVLDVVKVLGVNVRFLLRVSGFGFLEVKGCLVKDDGVLDLGKIFLEKGDKEEDMLWMFFLYNVDDCFRFIACLLELLVLLLLVVVVGRGNSGLRSGLGCSGNFCSFGNVGG